jgi:GxxExxY protein
MKHTTKEDLDKLSYEIIGAAIHVHKTLGPGLLESIYHECMEIELRRRGIQFETEFSIPLTFEGESLRTVFRCDLLIEGCIIVELKAVVEILPLMEAQVLTYMKLLKAPKGILINFNCYNIFRDGQKTFVNEHFRILAD